MRIINNARLIASIQNGSYSYNFVFVVNFKVETDEITQRLKAQVLQTFTGQLEKEKAEKRIDKAEPMRYGN